MKQFLFATTVAFAAGLLAPPAGEAQKFEDFRPGGKGTKKGFEDFKPGGYVPADGYKPDPKKVMFVICWHDKKLVNEFDYCSYYMNEDGVNDTTARKMADLMRQRYPNLVVYVKETNERDVKGVIEREKVRIKLPVMDWVDVKQPQKIEPPKRVGEKQYDYGDLGRPMERGATAGSGKLVMEETAKKSKVEGTTWIGSYTFTKGRTSTPYGPWPTKFMFKPSNELLEAYQYTKEHKGTWEPQTDGTVIVAYEGGRKLTLRIRNNTMTGQSPFGGEAYDFIVYTLKKQ